MQNRNEFKPEFMIDVLKPVADDNSTVESVELCALAGAEIVEQDFRSIELVEDDMSPVRASSQMSSSSSSMSYSISASCESLLRKRMSAWSSLKAVWHIDAMFRRIL